MKQLTIVLILSILTIPVFSQDLFTNITEKYAQIDGFSASNISSDMFEMYLKKKDIDKESPVYTTLQDLDNILLVSLRDFEGRKEEPTVQTMYDELNEYYKGSGYSLFKTERQMGEDVKVYLEKDNEDITSLALITSSEMSVHLVELSGLINMNTLSQLGRVMNLRGLENLYRVNNSTANSFRFGHDFDFNFDFDFEGLDTLDFKGLSPEQIEQIEQSFANRQWFDEDRLRELELKAQEMAEKSEYFNQEKIRQMEEKARQLAEQQHVLSEKQVRKIEEQAREMAERHIKMEEKYRQMAERYQREPIFLSAPGDTNTVYYLDGKKVKANKIKDIDHNTIKTIDITKGDKKGEQTIIKITTK